MFDNRFRSLEYHDARLSDEDKIVELVAERRCTKDKTIERYREVGDNKVKLVETKVVGGGAHGDSPTYRSQAKLLRDEHYKAVLDQYGNVVAEILLTDNSPQDD